MMKLIKRNGRGMEERRRELQNKFLNELGIAEEWEELSNLTKALKKT